MLTRTKLLRFDLSIQISIDLKRYRLESLSRFAISQQRRAVPNFMSKTSISLRRTLLGVHNRIFLQKLRTQPSQLSMTYLHCLAIDKQFQIDDTNNKSIKRRFIGTKNCPRRRRRCFLFD